MQSSDNCRDLPETKQTWYLCSPCGHVFLQRSIQLEKVAQNVFLTLVEVKNNIASALENTQFWLSSLNRALTYDRIALDFLPSG